MVNGTTVQKSLMIYYSIYGLKNRQQHSRYQLITVLTVPEIINGLL